MSQIDKQTMVILLLLDYLAEEGHFGEYKNDIVRFMTALRDRYYQDYSANETAEIKKSAKRKLKMLTSTDIYTDKITMLSVVLGICENYMDRCKGKRLILWNDLFNFCLNTKEIQGLKGKYNFHLSQFNNAEIIEDILEA